MTTYASFGRMPRERDEEIYRDHLITKRSDGSFKVTKDGHEIATMPTSDEAKAKVDVVLDFSG